jgi:diguanylate cyclase (GGDEF)-like protein
MIDLCDFKKFNDLYGHLVGDQILKMVARLLLQCTRKTDRVVRFGGDEFLVLMPNTPRDRAEMVKDRIEAAVGDHNDATQSQQDHFLLSIGLRSAEGAEIDNIIEDADEEMYKKKAAQSRQKLYNAFTSNNPDDIQKSDSFVAVLIKNLLEREPHFLDHARMVMLWSQSICQMMGANDEFIERVSLAALLHDIGKIALPSGLLSKTQPLNKEDRRHIRLHPMAGSDFLSGHEFLSDLRIIINHHHERWDGKTSGPHPGYPSGLAGELIPLGSRIIKIAETFDDLVSPRPFRPRPFTTRKALNILREEAGHALDPHLTSLFVQYVEMINQPLQSII